MYLTECIREVGWHQAKIVLIVLKRKNKILLDDSEKLRPSINIKYARWFIQRQVAMWFTSEAAVPETFFRYSKLAQHLYPFWQLLVIYQTHRKDNVNRFWKEEETGKKTHHTSFWRGTASISSGIYKRLASDRSLHGQTMIAINASRWVPPFLAGKRELIYDGI